MKLASLVFGDEPKKADSNKLSSPQPGQIVRTADGSTYRVASKLAGPDGTVLKLANLQGKPVPTPANFRPVGSAMARFASWMRYHLAYNADFDLYINSYIDRYNEQHPKEKLPYAVGPDGKPFRWADWFQNNINPRLNVPGDPSSDSVQDAKDELIHDMLYTTLGHRNILEDFKKKLPSFMTKNDKVKNLEIGNQLTHFLVKSFQFRIDEMNKKYRAEHPQEEVSMYQPADEENEEGLSEVNILDSEEHGVGEREFESAEAQKDIAKFAQGFRVWLKGAYGDKASESFGSMLDIFWRLLSENPAEIKRGELEEEWMQKTGLSFGSFKDYFARLPEVIEQYITSQEIEMDDQNIFVDLMNVIKKERTKRLRMERRQKEKARPAMVSSLHVAGIEGDIAEAIGETVSPATVDKDIAQPTVSVPEAAKSAGGGDDYGPICPKCDKAIMTKNYVCPNCGHKQAALYRILADSLAPNERMVTPEQAESLIGSILPGDRVTILVPAGMGRNGQEWSESTGKAVMRSAHGGWVLNMGGRHGTPGIADARNIVSVRPAKRASYLKQARLLPGDELTPEQIKQVKDAFIYRWTRENENRGRVYNCAKCDVANQPYENSTSAEGHSHPTIPLQSDEQWINEHAFYFLNDGRLDHRHRNAEPVYLAQRNNDVLASRTAALEFAIDKSLRIAAPATEGGQLACCGGWHGYHRENCSVRQQNDAKTIEMLKSLPKRGMLGHEFSDADHQSIGNETLPDTGMRPHIYDDAELKSGSIESCPHCKSAKIEVDASASGFEVYCDSCDGITGKYAAGSNSGKDDARGAGDLWRENFYENNEEGPSAKALFGAAVPAENWQCLNCGNEGMLSTTGTCASCGSQAVSPMPPEAPAAGEHLLHERVSQQPMQAAEKTAQGAGGTTVTMQNQNVTSPMTPGRGEPMAVPEAIDQTAGPHSPNAPATAPRTPGIQPKIVEVPQGTEGEASKTVQSSFKLRVVRKKKAAERCKECGEPLNNAEGELCGRCRAEGAEDRVDPFDKMGDHKPYEQYDRLKKHHDEHGYEIFETDDERQAQEEAELAREKEGAAVAPPPVVSPNVVQQQNISRPQITAPTPGATMAIMPGQNEEEGGIKRHTVEPELPNAKYHMQGAQAELIASEEERLMKDAGVLKQCKECGKIDPSVDEYEDGAFCTECAAGDTAE